MKLDLTDIPIEFRDGSVKPGNLYSSLGGAGPQKMWLVVSLTESGRTCHVLGIGLDGTIVSARSYATHCFEERALIGVCSSITDLQLNVKYLGAQL